MCEFCEEEKVIEGNFNFEIINKKYLIAWVQTGNYDRNHGDIEINFCPMCGRKLGDDND